MNCGSLRPLRLKASTKRLACSRSSADWLVKSETTTSTAALRKRLQNTECTSGSRSSSPNSASGRSHEIPHGPSAISAATAGELVSNEGRNIDHAHTTKPTATAAVAPLTEASFQKSAARIAGRNCATPANEMRPIGARASLSRVK